MGSLVERLEARASELEQINHGGSPTAKLLREAAFALRVHDGENIRLDDEVTRLTAEVEGGWMPTHRHYKGGLYRHLFIALDEPTCEPLVVYQGEDGQRWVRLMADFNATMPGGRRRFEPLPPPTTEGASDG